MAQARSQSRLGRPSEEVTVGRLQSEEQPEDLEIVQPLITRVTATAAVEDEENGRRRQQQRLENGGARSKQMEAGGGGREASGSRKSSRSSLNSQMSGASGSRGSIRQRGRRSSGSFRGPEESEEDDLSVSYIGVNSRRKDYERVHHTEDYDEVKPSDAVGGGGGDEMGEVQEEEEEKLKRKLKFFFMNPLDKYRATKQIPYKLLLQCFKVFLVTAQITVFGSFRYAHVNYYTDQNIAFEHFFIKDWDLVREVHAYPPATGALALYKKSEFYDIVDYSLESYKNIETDALGPFFRNSSYSLCVTDYRKATISPDLHYQFDSQERTRCIELEIKDLEKYNSSRKWMDDNNITLLWYSIRNIELSFNLTTVTLKPLGPVNSPDCFKFHVKLRLDNEDHDGQVPFSLTMNPVRLECPSGEQDSTSSYYPAAVCALNLFIMAMCLVSLILCVRAIFRAQLLRHETEIFVKKRFGWTLSINERLDFINLWYVLICVNDCLIILGSVMKQLIESKSIAGDMWDICSLMLGTGNLFVWFGLLRYLGFFKTYNVLILTMKGAAPNMLRFLLCASFIYIGYVFAGWLILGPYHFKFDTIMSTSECLFSLINGDDMFATFNSFPQEKSFCVWLYSRIYLYSFICLFIYVVLSLFISIIMDTYEIIKNCYERGFPANRIEQYYGSCKFDFSNQPYVRESITTRIWNILRHRNNEYDQLP